jgi:hypothetical protein
MGNIETYEALEEKEEQIIPKINPFHSKGKPYDVIIKYRLNRIENVSSDQWGYRQLYDLRNGMITNLWRLCTKIDGNDICFMFTLICDKITKNISLYYSNESTIYMTVLKGDKIRIELCADNIHSQRIHQLKINVEFSIWGFLQFDHQDKIPFAF